ncbi:MAG: hypothetical protein M0Z32_05615 [Actinomycetota bacterium]|nr:hypothetical protein [Actinomycetota bacterium]MCL6093012.1 hypothetical protein [Actinomycetota bacterium]MDA8167211.1 hypothetical protein [Actinomycetota bacterium]
MSMMGGGTMMKGSAGTSGQATANISRDTTHKPACIVVMKVRFQLAAYVIGQQKMPLSSHFPEQVYGGGGASLFEL